MGLLVAGLLGRHAGAEAGRYRITADACVALFKRPWTLNVRELDRTLQSAVVLARDGREIGVEHIGSPPGAEPDEESAPNAAQALREKLVGALTRHGGNISAVSREMGKARMQIHRWMDQLGIDAESFRKGR
jgi:transcriptional regulator of acetoin/glycerol metabolism